MEPSEVEKNELPYCEMTPGNHADMHDDDLVEEPRENRSSIYFFRLRLVHYMEHRWFHILIIAMVLFDFIIVVVSTLIDHDKTKKHITEILHYISLAVLSLFMLELIVKIFAHGKAFFKRKLEIFDGVVIIISFVLDVVLTVIHIPPTMAEMLIILRLWKMVRIVNAVIISVREETKKELHRVKKQLVEMEADLEAAQGDVSVLHDYCILLENKCKNAGGELPERPKLQGNILWNTE